MLNFKALWVPAIVIIIIPAIMTLTIWIELYMYIIVGALITVNQSFNYYKHNILFY